MAHDCSPIPEVGPDPDDRPPDGITYDPQLACFRNLRGGRMAHTFDARWFKRAGEFPVWTPPSDPDRAELTVEAVRAGTLGHLDRKAAVLRDEETPRYAAQLEVYGKSIVETDMAAAHARDVAAAKAALHGVETAVHDSIDHGTVTDPAGTPEHECNTVRERPDMMSADGRIAVDFKTTGDTGALLSERGKTHGNFLDNGTVSQDLKTYLREEVRADGSRGWDRLSIVQRESLDMIVHKIGRIMGGDADFRDHWDDIAGYAKLAAERCSK